MTILHNYKLQNWNLQVHNCKLQVSKCENLHTNNFVNLIICACQKILNSKIVSSKLQENNFATLQICRFPSYKSTIIRFQVHNLHELTKKQEGILWIHACITTQTTKDQCIIRVLYLGIATYTLKPIFILQTFMWVLPNLYISCVVDIQPQGLGLLLL
jgi:hypothetical protein